MVELEKAVSADDFPKEIRINLAISALGICLNLLVAFLLILRFQVEYPIAYLVGTLTNIFVSTGLRRCFLKRLMSSLNVPYGKLLVWYGFLSIASLWIVCLGVEYFGGSPLWVIPVVTVFASAANFILVGLWAFVVYPIREVVYEELDGAFFDDMVDKTKVGRFRACIHQSRFKMTRNFVKRYYTAGKQIVDFAAGSCGWNTEGLPVMGLDVNEKMLGHGLRKGRLKEYQVGDIYASPLPRESADIVVSSQVFEHLNDPPRALAEIGRVLKPNGVFVIDVPYDLFLGPHFLLFNVHCFIEGYLKGRELYKQRCGHLNHFTKKGLTELLRHGGFKVREIRLCNFLTLHAVAYKNDRID